MASIPESTIKDILAKIDIVALIGGYVRLQRAGAQYKGLCPFHSERTPSFYVTPGKGIFYCFGCQKGGDAITFLREHDKLTFGEAVHELASKAGVDLQIEEAQPEEENERRSLLELNERIAGTFSWVLMEHPTGAPALQRLYERKIPEEIIREFRLGYSPPDRNWLFSFLKNKGYSDAFLSRSGLFAANNAGFPLFAGRIMFPIADVKGRIIAFGGRIFDGKGPKYLNSPDTLLFHKHESLFALDKAVQAIKKEGVSLICEGYMDALAFHTAGVNFAVAPLGTAFTLFQARLLKRWSDRVLLCFDSDAAGLKATEKACVTAAQAGLQPSVILLPGGKDASEILEKEGPRTLQQTANFTINVDEFLTRRARGLFDTGTVVGKSQAAAYVFPFADAIESEIKRAAFLDFSAREFGANPISLRADYDSAKRKGHIRIDHDDPLAESASDAGRTTELVFMSAVLLDGAKFAEIRSQLTPADFIDQRARDIYIALEEAYRSDDMGIESVLSRIKDNRTCRFIRERAASGELLVNSDRFISDGILAVKIRSLERKRDRILSRMAAYLPDASREDASLNDLLYEKMHLDAELEAIKGERDERA